jgi:DUF1365 family protein
MGWHKPLPIIAKDKNPSMMPKPALYVGRVRHHRKAPHAHSLSYGTYQLLLDIETITQTKWFSHNRFNLFSFYDSDHGPDQENAKSASLSDRIFTLLQTNDLYEDGDRLFLLAMPRFLGFVFNPISLYFHYRHNEQLVTILYEVNNTFGDRHTYILKVMTENNMILDQSSPKMLHVSPFMDMDMKYRFQITNPGDDFSLRILLLQDELLMLTADLSLQRQDLSDSALMKRAIKMPFLTLGAVLAIHWEALFIWTKGNAYRDKPKTLKSSVSRI